MCRAVDKITGAKQSLKIVSDSEFKRGDETLTIKKIISVLLIVFGIAIMLQGWFPSDQKIVKKALEKME